MPEKVVERAESHWCWMRMHLNLLAEENGKALEEEAAYPGAEGRVIILTPHVGELSDCLRDHPGMQEGARSVAENWQNGFMVWRLPRMQERLYVKNRENFI